YRHVAVARAFGARPILGQHAQLRPVGGFPDPNGAVSARRDQPSTIGAVDSVVDRVAMREREQELVGTCIPDPRGLIVRRDDFGGHRAKTSPTTSVPQWR